MKFQAVTFAAENTRKSMTEYLSYVSTLWLASKGYSVHRELGLIRRGRLRADVYGFTTSLHTVLVEVKSCPADFNVDGKLHLYREFCDRMYVCVDSDTYKKVKTRLLELCDTHTMGILIVNPETGYIKVHKNCKYVKSDMKVKKPIIIRAAYRAGTHRLNVRSTLEVAVKPRRTKRTKRRRKYK